MQVVTRRLDHDIRYVPKRLTPRLRPFHWVWTQYDPKIWHSPRQFPGEAGNRTEVETFPGAIVEKVF